MIYILMKVKGGRSSGFIQNKTEIKDHLLLFLFNGDYINS